MILGQRTLLALGFSLAAVPVLAAPVSIEFNDGKVAPLHIEVPANKAFKIELHNSGKTAAEFESHELHKEKVIAPKSTTSVSVHALAPGNYKFFDDFHEDAPKGVIVAK